MNSKEIMFGSGPDFSLNACVGENAGGDGDYSYVLGFAQAALVLINAAKVQHVFDPDSEEEMFVAQDALIYPICFNARHHIELFLKRQIQRVAKLRDSVFNEKLLVEHELGDLLKELTKLCIITDRRLPDFLQPLRFAIDAFAAIDPSGQIFRYSRSLNNELHLKQLQHINLELLERSLKKLFDGTENFEMQVDVLTYEYGQGTMTEELSRSEIKKLAKSLPPRSTWSESSDFHSVKKAFMQEFKLSGRAFKRAVDLIITHYEFAGFIGLELPVPYIDKTRLKKLVSLDADEQVFNQLSRQELGALAAILEVGNDDVFSEVFAHRVRRIESGEETLQLPHDVVRGLAVHTLRFRQGLIKLGLVTLVAEVDQGMATRKDASRSAVEKFNQLVVRHYFGKVPSGKRRRLNFKNSSDTLDDE